MVISNEPQTQSKRVVQSSPSAAEGRQSKHGPTLEHGTLATQQTKKAPTLQLAPLPFSKQPSQKLSH